MGEDSENLFKIASVLPQIILAIIQAISLTKKPRRTCIQF